ncbi:MAG TPA: hypothetical protein VIU61_16965 [Kofleriaceae bacterium]
MTIGALAVRTYVRYVVPLTVLAAIACAPLVWYALGAKPPPDAGSARAMLRVMYVIGATAWIWQIMLTGAAAELVPGVAARAPLGQLAATWRGFVGLVRAIVPGVAAAAAIVVGGLALVVPGLVLLVLLAMTGAASAHGMPGALAESIAAVRARPRAAVIVTAMVVIVDVAIAVAGKLAIAASLPKKPSSLLLATYPRALQLVVVAIVIVSPILACALAAVHHRPRSE